MKRAGNVSVMAARAMVTWASSSGCRSTSSTLRRNSGNSSRNSTPLCARLTSPGPGIVPPPMSPASDVEWCGARNGRVATSARSRFSSPAMLWIFDVSMASSRLMSGRIDGSRRARSDLPDPGGPIRRRLCTKCPLHIPAASRNLGSGVVDTLHTSQYMLAPYDIKSSRAIVLCAGCSLASPTGVADSPATARLMLLPRCGGLLCLASVPPSRAGAICSTVPLLRPMACTRVVLYKSCCLARGDFVTR